MNKIIYTDGACKGNPGPGGWGFLILENGVEIDTGCGNNPETTNNRMEMVAVIESLKSIEGTPGQNIEIRTDSSYIVNCFNQNWMTNWIKKGWINSSKKPVLNKDLWVEMKRLVELHTYKFVYVKAHADDDYNNKVDEIASSEAFKLVS